MVIKIKLIEDPPGPPVLSTYLTKIHGTSKENTIQMTKDLKTYVGTVDEVVDIDTTLNEVTAD